MARILCSNGGSAHTHNSVYESKICYGIIRVHRPAPAPAPPIPPDHATRNQIDYIRSLGGDMRAAYKMTKSQASQYIDQLKAEAKSKTPATGGTKVQSKVPVEWMQRVPNGYYAWQPDSETPLTFLRVSRPKTGRMANCIKVQTQHGPNLSDPVWVAWPSGQVSVYRSMTIEETLLGIIVDYKKAARTYANEKGNCARCNTDLTDPRSRHYGIGPECEKQWPWMIEELDEELGYSFGYGPALHQRP